MKEALEFLRSADRTGSRRRQCSDFETQSTRIASRELQVDHHQAVRVSARSAEIAAEGWAEARRDA